MYFVYVGIGKEGFSILELIKIIAMYRTGPLLGAIWFLRVLFWAVIIYDVANRLCSNKRIVYLLAIILLIIGAHITLPLRISNIMVALSFIAIGNIAHEYELQIRKRYCIPCFAVVVIASLFTRVSVSTNTYTIPVLFIVVAIVGTIGTISFSQVLVKADKILNPLCWLGKNTIGIVIWQFIAFKIVIAIQIIVYGLGWSRIWDFPVIYEYATPAWVILSIIIGIFVSVSIYFVQEKMTKMLLKPIDRIILHK